jgi:hypothetical protein
MTCTATGLRDEIRRRFNVPVNGRPAHLASDAGTGRPPFRNDFARGDTASSGSDTVPPSGLCEGGPGCRRRGLRCATCADVMRLKAAGMPSHEIAWRVGSAPSTVQLTIRRFEASGLTWPLPDVTDTVLEARLYASQSPFEHAFPAASLCSCPSARGNYEPGMRSRQSLHPARNVPLPGYGFRPLAHRRHKPSRRRR